MTKGKIAYIDIDFEKTIRNKYPFARSLVQITKIMNKELMEQLYGESNAKKKR